MVKVLASYLARNSSFLAYVGESRKAGMRGWIFVKRWMVELQRKGTLVGGRRGKGLCLLAKGPTEEGLLE